jgi:hypothetical protein
MREVCPNCDGVGYICLNCKEAIDECECMEDSMPCPCEKCSPLVKDPNHDRDHDDEEKSHAR